MKVAYPRLLAQDESCVHLPLASNLSRLQQRCAFFRRKALSHDRRPNCPQWQTSLESTWRHTGSCPWSSPDPPWRLLASSYHQQIRLPVSPSSLSLCTYTRPRLGWRTLCCRLLIPWPLEVFMNLFYNRRWAATRAWSLLLQLHYLHPTLIRHRTWTSKIDQALRMGRPQQGRLFGISRQAPLSCWWRQGDSLQGSRRQCQILWGVWSHHALHRHHNRKGCGQEGWPCALARGESWSVRLGAPHLRSKLASHSYDARYPQWAFERLCRPCSPLVRYQSCR